MNAPRIPQFISGIASFNLDWLYYPKLSRFEWHVIQYDSFRLGWVLCPTDMRDISKGF